MPRVCERMCMNDIKFETNITLNLYHFRQRESMEHGKEERKALKILYIYNISSLSEKL
jgi:hypothetical protein